MPRVTRVIRGPSKSEAVASKEEKIEEMETDVPEVPEVPVRPHWQKVGPNGKKLKSKPCPVRRNAFFRKHLQPKTAMQCLVGLVKDVKYEVEESAPVGNFSASVVVNGETYRGFGSSKTLAKQACAEAAMVSFVKPPPEDKDAVDETPWKYIASLALYKMFTEWSEQGAGDKPSAAAQAQIPTDIRGVKPSLQSRLGVAATPGAAPDLRNYLCEVQFQQKAAASNGTPAAPKPEKQQTVIPKPAAKLSEENKINQHPLVVINQLCPTIKFTTEEKVLPDKSRSFNLSAEVEGNVFSAEGPNIKKTKYALAKVILKEAWDIDNVYELPKSA